MSAQKLHLLHTTQSRLMRLGPNLNIDVDSIIGEGIVGFGIKGSGKTNAGALLAEQFGQYYVPMVVFDLEGDYLSLADVLPRGIVADVTNFPTGYDVLEKGLQVIYDLSTWPNDELAACSMMHVVQQLTRWANTQAPEDRVPCLVFLDEAAHWLPQKKADHLGDVTRVALLDTFRTLAVRGRKRGLIPALFTQRSSTIHKDVISQAGVQILMEAKQPCDLEVYRNYLQTSDLLPKQLNARISSFTPGEAFVVLPGGELVHTTFYRRQSVHISHTPKVDAALTRYAEMPFNPKQKFAAYQGTDEPQQEDAPEEKPVDLRPVAKKVSPKAVKRVTKRNTVKPNRNKKSVTKATVTKRAPRVPGHSIVKDRIVSILQETPDISTYELARQARCSASDVKRYRAEIEQTNHE